MPLDKKTYLWGETGTQTTPSAARQQSGWVPGEQPTVGDENWIQYQQDLHIKELQVGDAPETTHPDMTKNEFATRDVSAPWAFPWDSYNEYSAGSSAAFVDMSICYKSGEKRLLLADQNNGDIYLVDTVDATLDTKHTYATISASLPATAGSWKILGAIGDTSYFYLLVEESGVGAGTERHFVQSFDLTTAAANPSWPATGTQITTGTLASELRTGQDNRMSRIIFAGTQANGRIVTLNNWVSDTTRSVSTPILSCLRSSTGALLGEGAGNLSSVAGVNALCSSGGITSNWRIGGADVIFYALTTASGAYGGAIICAATLDTLGNPTGLSTSLPYTTSFGTAEHLCNDLHFDGYNLWGPIRDVNSDATPVNPDERLFSIWDVQTTTGVPRLFRQDPDHLWMRYMAQDGFGLYLTGRLPAVSGGGSGNTSYNMIAKMDLGGTAYQSAPTETYNYLTPMLKSRFRTEPVANASTSQERDATVDYLGPIVFDGRDVWTIYDIRSSQTLSGYVRRIPRTAIR